MLNTRLLAERAGIGLITILAPLVPCLLGLGYYLALTPEGITFNVEEPTRVGRLWMTRDRRPTGIALQTTEPVAGSLPGSICARTTFAYLSWEKRLNISRDSSSCQCPPAANKGESAVDQCK